MYHHNSYLIMLNTFIMAQRSLSQSNTIQTSTKVSRNDSPCFRIFIHPVPSSIKCTYLNLILCSTWCLTDLFAWMPFGLFSFCSLYPIIPLFGKKMQFTKEYTNQYVEHIRDWHVGNSTCSLKVYKVHKITDFGGRSGDTRDIKNSRQQLECMMHAHDMAPTKLLWIGFETAETLSTMRFA